MSKIPVTINAVNDTQDLFTYICENILKMSKEAAIDYFIGAERPGNKIKFSDLLIIIGKAELDFAITVYHNKDVNWVAKPKVTAQDPGLKETGTQQKLNEQSSDIENKDLVPDTTGKVVTPAEDKPAAEVSKFPPGPNFK